MDAKKAKHARSFETYPREYQRRVSNLVAAISGKVSGDERFFFPKEMKSSEQQLELFGPIYSEFQSYLKNDTLIKK